MPAVVKGKKKKRLVLLDAHAIIHRAYHALPEFTSAKGEPTGGLYGLSAMLMKLIVDLKPDYLAACYDLPEPTYRHEAYEGYKAGREKADDALVAQINRSRDIFAAFNIPIYEKAGYEADDLLGTIVEQTKKNKGIEVIIASGDMDTLQLVEGKRVRVYTMRKGMTDTVLYDETAVRERFDFGPELLADYKGLRGDPSDNIIGVRGVGEKTATSLIVAFGTIEDMYRAIKKNSPKLKAAGVSERIAELLRSSEEEALFSKELATIHRNVPVRFSLPKEEWRAGVRTENILALFTDLSFRTLRERAKELFGLATSAEEEPERAAEAVDERALTEAKIALWLIDSEQTNPSLEDVLAFGKTHFFTEARGKLDAELKKRNLTQVYEEIELPLIPIIERMESRGILVDTAYLGKLSKEYHAALTVVEKDIFKYANETFNVNSPRQLGDILFTKLNLSVKNHKKTGTGQKSTRESELEKMRDAHPIIPAILEHREIQKLLSTYVDNIPGMVDGARRLHAKFLQTGTTTGRMSSQTPNLQNIPIQSERGRNIRRAFVSGNDFSLVACDYSQIQLRVAAFLSGDEKLIGIFKSGGDVHTAVAAQVFKVPEGKVDREMRRRAKVINFGILYGMGVNALRANLGTSRAEAQQFYNDYFATFQGLARYLDRVKGEVARRGYTETFYGRRRYFEGIRSSLPYLRAAAERMAINAPIQGTEADIMKVAMIRVDEYVRGEGLADDIFLLLQVHDELVYEVRAEKVGTMVPALRSIMENVLPLKDTAGVKLAVDVSVGENWGDMERV